MPGKLASAQSSRSACLAARDPQRRGRCERDERVRRVVVAATGRCTRRVDGRERRRCRARSRPAVRSTIAPVIRRSIHSSAGCRRWPRRLAPQPGQRDARRPAPDRGGDACEPAEQLDDARVLEVRDHRRVGNAAEPVRERAGSPPRGPRRRPGGPTRSSSGRRRPDGRRRSCRRTRPPRRRTTRPARPCAVAGMPPLSAAGSSAPTNALGSAPVSARTQVSQPAVVLLPCVPATATSVRPCAASAMTCCQGSAGMPRAAAARSSGWSGAIAVRAFVTARRSGRGPSVTCAAWCDQAIGMPTASSAAV